MTSRPRRTAAHLPRQVGPDRGPVPCSRPSTSVVRFRGKLSSPFDFIPITLEATVFVTTLCLTVTVGKPVASSTFIIPRLDPTKLGPPQATQQKKTTPTKGEEYATLCGGLHPLHLFVPVHAYHLLSEKSSKGGSLVDGSFLIKMQTLHPC